MPLRLLSKPISTGLLLIALALVASVVYSFRKPSYDFPLGYQAEKVIEDVSNGTGSLPVNQYVAIVDGSGAAAVSSAAKPLPRSVRIDVPFLVQAPTGNWGLPYQEACEEASLLTVSHFLEGTPVTPELADREILDLVSWENETFNYSADITLEELKRVAEDHYHYSAQLFYDFTIDDMKRLLSEGHPIIVPLAGRDIGNPYYSGEGPWYHMLVVTGYDGDRFITNDVGTRRGHGYMYKTSVLYDAIHDWAGVKEDIRQGRRVIMVLSK
jgi:hypothetical protein